MSIANELPRDVFINEIYSEALTNRDIYFMSADLGAKALDRFRAEMNGQFIHAGISEQAMIDIAAGLALDGKLVYVYAMAPFVTLRCYEQIKVAMASMNLPITVVGVGVGFSYDDAGPTHYGTEDISCMRALGGIEIITPCDTQSTIEAARLTYRKPHPRYIRLDRVYLPSTYAAGEKRFVQDGIVEVEPGQDMCIMTAGYMVHKGKEIKRRLAGLGLNIGVIDVFRLKPINGDILASVLKPYRKVVTLEEHFLSGGLGSAIVESLVDFGIRKEVQRIGVQDRYYCENGGRDYLHRLAQIDVESATKRLTHFSKQ